MTSRPTPPVGEGETAPAGSWTLLLTPAGTVHGTTQGVIAGAHEMITVEPHTGASVCKTTKAVAFHGTPKLTVVATTGTTVAATKIKLTPTMSGNNGCTGFFAPNVLTVNFTTTVHFTKDTGFIAIHITTVAYSVAPKTAPGTVTVSSQFFPTKTTNKTTGTNKTQTSGTVTSTNAVVSHAYVASTVKSIAPTAYDAPIGNISVVESVAGSVPKNAWVCATLKGSTRTTTGTGNHGNSHIAHNATGWSTSTFPPTTGTDGMYFNTTSAPKVAVSPGNGTASTVGFSTVGVRAQTVRFKVTAASTTASTYTLSGLAVNVTGTAETTAFPLVTVFYASNGTCTAAASFTGVMAPTDHVAVAFTTTRQLAKEIYGATAAGTAAAALETAYRGTGAPDSCPLVTQNFGGPATVFLQRTERPVVLATSKTYPDALSSQYLAGALATGTLLTTPTALPQVTINALRVEGISHVYVVGGPLAVSTAIVSQIETLPVYNCGGNGLARNINNQTGYIQVTRIGGKTQYDTAQMIAEFVSPNMVTTLAIPAAYKGGPTGHGMYNDTTGIGSTAVATGGFLKTGILASGAEFQDAMSASPLSWYAGYPMLLTTPTSLSPQAKTVIVSLHLRQIIVMGGPLAITNTVVKQLEAITVTGHPVSVLRIAGKDYTDTAVQLAKMELASGTTTAGFGAQPTALIVSRGNGFSDGITGAVLEHLARTTGTTFMPLMLTENPTTVGTYLTAFLKTVGATGTGYATGYTFTLHKTVRLYITHLLILGGPLAVTPAVITQMVNDL
jgi:putative cell wall-binding protein